MDIILIPQMFYCNNMLKMGFFESFCDVENDIAHVS